MYENMSHEELIAALQKADKERESRLQRECRRKVRGYHEMNQRAKKGQILFTGSSLMEYFPVAEYCLSDGLDKIVYNRGISGTTTDDFLAEIDAVLFELEPSKVFINIGTNDIRERSDGEYWQDHLLKNYEKIMCQIKERLPDAQIYVMAYYPVNIDFAASLGYGRSAFTRNNTAINDTNAKIADLAQKYGFHYIDVNDGIKDENGNLRAEITVEGLHIHAGGYASVYEKLKQYL